MEKAQECLGSLSILNNVNQNNNFLMIKIWKIQIITIYWNLKNEKVHEKNIHCGNPKVISDKVCKYKLSRTPATSSQKTETSGLSWLNGGTGSKFLYSSKLGLSGSALIICQCFF